jgi:PAS domain S-box-containing protein
LGRLPQAIINAIAKFKVEKERKHYLELLIRSEKKFKAIVELGQDCITLMDESFKLNYVSPGTEKILGWDTQVPIHGIFENVHPDDFSSVESIKSFALHHPNDSSSILFRINKKDQQYIWIEGTIANYLDDENVGAIVANVRDV